MLNFGEMRFSAEELQRIETSVDNYRRFARLSIEAVPIGDTFNLIIRQFAIPDNGRVLTNGELIDRAQDIFRDFIGLDQFVITPQTFENE